MVRDSFGGWQMKQDTRTSLSKTPRWPDWLFSGRSLAPILLVIAGAAGAQESQFMLRAPASEIVAIATTHGLTIVDEVEVSQDPLGRRVYLIETAAGIDPDQVVANVATMEPSTAGIEVAVLASVRESFESGSLNQDTSSLPAILADDTEVFFGDDGDGDNDDNDRLVWQGYVNQSAAALINVDQAQSHYRGDATVAIIDTGIDPGHPLLSANIVGGYDFVNETAGRASEWPDLDQSAALILDQSAALILDQSAALILDQSAALILDQSAALILDTSSIPPAFGHGTMVAGIIHRVAPAAKLMPLKAFDGNGSASLFDIVRAIYYAVDNGANVINMSFSIDTFSPELMRAVNYATRNGVTCVASAGNQGEEMLVYPAALGNTIGVASTAANDVISSFSNHGSDLITVAAPGEEIITTYPGVGWAMVSGTSFSAPWVTGAIALFADKNGTHHAPGKADYYLASEALSYAFPVHGTDNEGAGHGRIDLDRAVDELESN
jgi:subtilisin family serine protease